MLLRDKMSEILYTALFIVCFYQRAVYIQLSVNSVFATFTFSQFHVATQALHSFDMLCHFAAHRWSLAVNLECGWGTSVHNVPGLGMAAQHCTRMKWVYDIAPWWSLAVNLVWHWDISRSVTNVPVLGYGCTTLHEDKVGLWNCPVMEFSSKTSRECGIKMVHEISV